MPCESTSFELTGFAPTGAGGRYQPADLLAPADEVPYEAAPTPNPCRRTLKRVRTLYRSDDLVGLLPLGQLESLALPGEDYGLAFTPGLLDQVFRRPRAGQPDQALLPDPAAVLEPDGGYVRSQTLKGDGRFPAADADDEWWIPGGRSFLSPGPGDTSAAELAQAQAHFFLARRYRDAFGQDTLVDYDSHGLLVVATQDALGNRNGADVNDYRVLQPRRVSDPNGNRVEVAFDALGLVAGRAAMGKPAHLPIEGDSLDNFAADLTQAQANEYFADPPGQAAALLQDASIRIVYDLDRFRRTRQASPDHPASCHRRACASRSA